MKRGTPDHPKVLELAELLGVRRPTAIGHLELLFHFTAQYAPEGNIGKYSNKRIAAALDWNGRTDDSADKFIQSFIESGWIDHCQTNRLVTHDWAVHMDRVTRQRLKNAGRDPVDSPPSQPPRKNSQPPPSTLEHPTNTLRTPYETPRRPLGDPYDTRSGPLENISRKKSTQSNHKDSGKSCTQSEPYTSPLPSTSTTTTTTTSTSTAAARREEHDSGSNGNGSLNEPLDNFLSAFVGPVPNKTYQTFASVVKTPGQIQAVLENTPLWMETAAYKTGFHNAVAFLESGVWKKPPKPQMLKERKGAHDAADALVDEMIKNGAKW